MGQSRDLNGTSTRPEVGLRVRILVPTTRTLAWPPHTLLPSWEEAPPAPSSRTHPFPAPKWSAVRTSPSIWDTQSSLYIPFQISTTLFSGLLLFFPRKHHYAVGQGGSGRRGFYQLWRHFIDLFCVFSEDMDAEVPNWDAPINLSSLPPSLNYLVSFETKTYLLIALDFKCHILWPILYY